jgi:FkbM family methyltransferase
MRLGRFPLNWSRHHPAKLSHNNALRRLAQMGFAPKVIYDIGAYRGNWSKAASEVFPAAEFVMFDANADNDAHLAATGRRHVIAALSSEDAAAKSLFLPRTGDSTGTSFYVENTPHYAAENLRIRTVATMRLDTIVASQSLPRPDLVKLDVQGAELDVMKGATQTLCACNAMILETAFVTYNKSAPLIADVIAAVDRDGWKCVDVCELHRTKSGIAVQLDLLFVKPGLFGKFCAAAGIL